MHPCAPRGRAPWARRVLRPLGIQLIWGAPYHFLTETRLLVASLEFLNVGMWKKNNLERVKTHHVILILRTIQIESHARKELETK